VPLDRLPLRGRQLVIDGLERDELIIDEGAHPGQLRGKLRFGFEVPGQWEPP
jgi:hypothetical protein